MNPSCSYMVQPLDRGGNCLKRVFEFDNRLSQARVICWILLDLTHGSLVFEDAEFRGSRAGRQSCLNRLSQIEKSLSKV